MSTDVWGERIELAKKNPETLDNVIYQLVKGNNIIISDVLSQETPLEYLKMIFLKLTENEIAELISNAESDMYKGRIAFMAADLYSDHDNFSQACNVWINTAEAMFKKCLNENENDTIALTYLGNVYYLKKDFDEAISYYSQTLILNKQNIDVFNKLGCAFLSRGKFYNNDNDDSFKAIKCYEDALKLDPSNILVWKNLKTAYLSRGSFCYATHCGINIKLLELKAIGDKVKQSIGLK